MTPDDTSKLVSGMVAGGAGAGLLGILYDAIRSERRKTRAVQGKNNPGALEIYLPPQKQAVMGETVAALAAGAGTTAIVQALYKKWKTRQLQGEVDDAAIGYLGDVGKTAAITPVQMIKDLPRDLMLIASLAGAAGTYGLLEHSFPKVKEKPGAGAPRRIVVKGYGPVTADGPGDGPLAAMDQTGEPKPAKAAAFGYGPEDGSRALEALCLTLAEVPLVKDAGSPLFELVGSYYDDPTAVTLAVKHAGILGAVAAAKGGAANFYKLTELGRRRAVKQAVASPLLAPSLASLAIAEYNELQPFYAKMARVQAGDPVRLILLTKLASVLHAIDTGHAINAQSDDKLAAAMGEDWRKEMATLDVTEAEDSHGDDIDLADDVYSSGQDPIDRFMAGDTSNAVLH